MECACYLRAGRFQSADRPYLPPIALTNMEVRPDV